MFSFLIGLFLGHVITVSTNITYLTIGSCVREVGSPFIGEVSYINYQYVEVSFPLKKEVYRNESVDSLVEVECSK